MVLGMSNATATTIATPATTVHKFELAGLGRAPFRFVRVERRVYQACPDAPIQPGGSCAFCGEGLIECYVIRSSDAREFIVGCVCVYKTDDRGLIDLVKRAANKAKCEAKHARDAARIEACRRMLDNDAVWSALEALPHPRGFAGASLATWCTWMLRNSGARGSIEVCKVVEPIAAKVTA